jgi:hypothetical protein
MNELPAGGIKLIQRSSAQLQLSRDWLHNQLEQLAP